MYYDDVTFGPPPSPFSKEVGRLIRQARTEKGMNQAELAEALGRRQASISEMENGKMEPEASTLIQMSLILGKPVAYFFPARFRQGEYTEDRTQLTVEEQLLLNYFQRLITTDNKELALLLIQTVVRHEFRQMHNDSDNAVEDVMAIFDAIEVGIVPKNWKSASPNDQIEDEKLPYPYRSEGELRSFKYLANTIMADVNRMYTNNRWDEFDCQRYLDEIEARKQQFG